MADVTFLPQLLNNLLTTPSVEEQAALLSMAGLLTPEGLSGLLDEAEQRMGVDPNQAQLLALLCSHLATTQEYSGLMPRNDYLFAQIAASKGEFSNARTWLEKARKGYSAQGMQEEALRINVGLMAILGDTGNYQEALSVGKDTLAQLGIASTNIAGPNIAGPNIALADTFDDAQTQRTSPKRQMLAALIFQNCGHCNEAMGRYDAALVDYQAARIRYEALAEQERLGQVIENSALVYIALGEVQRGLAGLEEALQIYRQANLELFQAEALFNIAEAHLLLSNFVESLHAFEESEQLLAARGELLDHHLLLRLKADAYLSLNLYGEALDAYRESLHGLQTAGVVYHHAFAVWGMGMVFTAQDQLSEAQNALTEAATYFRRLDNLPLLTAVRLEEAALLYRQGNIAAAQQLAEEQLRQIVDSEWSVQKLYAYLRNADLALPDTEAAERYLLAAEPLVNTLGLPQLRYRYHQRLGHLRLLQGDEQQADLYLRRAIDEIERQRGTLLQERMLASFLNDKMSAYQDLVHLYLNRGDNQSIQQAFEIAERAKSRALVDLLSGVIQARIEQSADDASLAELQRWQSELNAIYNDLLAGDSQNRLRAVDHSQLHTRALELEQAIGRARLRPTQGQRLLSMQAVQPLHLDKWLATLPSDLTMLVYHVVGDEVMAFVCHAGEMSTVRHLATVAEISQLQTRLHVHWERFRVDFSVLQPHMEQLQRSVQRILQALYQSLLAPVLHKLASLIGGGTEAQIEVQSHNLKAAQGLVIVPHSLLHQIPFHALYDGTKYLIESFTISYAPSATVFDLCQRRVVPSNGQALVVGMADALIPAVEAETLNVQRQLVEHDCQVRVLLNEDAKMSRLNDGTHPYEIVHFACHGLFRHDNPMFSALKLFDGWLTAADVSQLDFSGALVTLSACESGTSQVIGGDEILGLTYAFLSAGAATLVVSQWLVQDEVTASLMEQWYQKFLGSYDLASSLRNAQLEIMQRYPHPYYWAPFKLVGQRIRNLSSCAGVSMTDV